MKTVTKIVGFELEFYPSSMSWNNPGPFRADIQYEIQGRDMMGREISLPANREFYELASAGMHKNQKFRVEITPVEDN